MDLLFEIEMGYDLKVESASITYINENGSTLEDHVPVRGDLVDNFLKVLKPHLDKMDSTWKWASTEDNLEDQLIRLGSTNPELRDDLRPILDALSTQE